MRTSETEFAIPAQPLSPLLFLRHHAQVSANRIAVSGGGEQLTYAGLESRARQLASGLRGLGVRSGDRVAVLSPNRQVTLDAHFGVPAAGAVLVALNTRLNREEIAFILNSSRPRVLIVDGELGGLVDEFDGERVVSTGRADAEYEALLEASGPIANLLENLESESQLISVNYTSGTTGEPKGAVYTHRGAFLQALSVSASIGLASSSTFLWTLPMFHCNGWCFPWGVTAVGARHLLLERVDPGRVWGLLRSEGVTHYCCAPTVQISIVSDRAARTLEHSVRVAMGGAPPSPALIARMRQLGFDAIHLYGLTETYGPKTGLMADPSQLAGLGETEAAKYLARQGFPISPVDELRVVDDRGVELPADGASLGEVVIRGETVTPGFFGQPANATGSFRDDWLLTGDLAVRYPDGSIELRDRKKDIIISGGENISSIEVEHVMSEHEAVLECAVVAMRDEHWGERPKAFVTLRQGHQVSENELIEHCRARLAHFKCPDAIEFGTLPKTATGKIRKRQLREAGLSS